MDEKKTLKYFSTFSGIGGFELGIERAHCWMVGERGASAPLSRGRETEHRARVDTQQAHQQGDHGTQHGTPIISHCVGFSELDKYAVQIYQSHFPAHKNYGDITKINIAELPDFELLVGGFPCQSFSIAGRRGGFSDTRGTLFFDLARILEAKRPRLFLFENVKGLLSHDEGRTFATIVRTLDELGYDLQWQVLNSKNFGVPQNRERIFIIGHTRGTPRPQVFPFGSGDGKHPDKADLERCAVTLTGRSAGGGNRRGNYVVGTLRTHKDGEGFREIRSRMSPTIPARAREDESGQPVIYIDNLSRIRRLSPVECERLQSFPDGWTEAVSDTQRYKTLGNAVTVNVIEAIIERML